jgi:L-asparaginase II
MVAGTGRFDSRVAAQLDERVYCKVGAEGGYCAAFPKRGLGVAIKMDDGNNARACEVVMAAVIAGLLTLHGMDSRFVNGLQNLTMHNWGGIEVEQLRAAPGFAAQMVTVT